MKDQVTKTRMTSEELKKFRLRLDPIETMRRKAQNKPEKVIYKYGMTREEYNNYMNNLYS